MEAVYPALNLLACLHQSPHLFLPDDTDSLLIPAQRPVIVRAPSSLVRRSCRQRAEPMSATEMITCTSPESEEDRATGCGRGAEGARTNAGEPTQEILQTRSLSRSGRGQGRLSAAITLHPLRVNPSFHGDRP
jgi:hypothetical protein